MKIFAACLTMILLSHTSLGLAQDGKRAKGYRSQATAGYGVPGNHYGFGAPVAGQIHHSSTYEEGVMRGTAAIIQAQGQYNLLSSLAMLNMAQYQRMQYEHQQLVAANQAAMRQAYLERRDAKLAAQREWSRNRIAQVVQR